MIDIPKDVVVRRIIEQKGLDQSKVGELIQEKLDALSGLISEEGAAHIVANDLGVKLFKTEGAIKINELTTAAKSVTVEAKVLRKFEMREFDKNGRKGKVANLMVGDASGRTRMVFWNDQVDVWEKLKENDIVRVENPFVKENNGQFELHMNDRSNLEINPSGLQVSVPASGGFDRPERELKYLKDLQGNEENVEVLGAIVQVYDPRFFDVCPECNKRVTDDNKCGQHGTVTPVTNYVTSCFLDDGTGNIRTTFWKNQSQHLFGLTDAEILKWKDDATLAEPAKHDLIGEIIKIVGRCKKNEQFDRVELTASLVFKDVNPEEELAKLEKKAGASSPTPESAGTPTPESPSPESPSTPAETTPSSEKDSEKEEPDKEESKEKDSDKKEDLKEKGQEEIPDDEVPAPATQEEREVKPEDVKFDTADEIEPVGEEEVISLDDLEDLDEKQ